MFVSAKHNFGFIHIPKCAGSTIRQPLREKDDFGGKFYRSIEVPELGLVNANHLPLHILQTYFPDAFEAVRDVTSYTVTREPMDRFISGIAQFLRGEGREPGELDTAELLATAHGVVDYMEAVEGLTDFPHTLFIRQEDYIRLNGTQIVSHVFPMERMDALLDRMERVHDLPLSRDSVWNPTVTYRFPVLTEKLKATKDLAKRMLPVQAYARVRDIGIGLLTTRGVPKLNETLEADPKVRDFVASYYAGDRDLHAQALAALT